MSTLRIANITSYHYIDHRRDCPVLWVTIWGWTAEISLAYREITERLHACIRELRVGCVLSLLCLTHSVSRFYTYTLGLYGMETYVLITESALSDGDVYDTAPPILWSLRSRHNDNAGVSNHQSRDCLLNRLFRRRSKKTSKLRVIGLCAGNSPGTGEFPAQMASNAENVSISWRHHVSPNYVME